MFVLYLLFFNGSAVSERIVSQQTRSDLRELLLDLDAQGWIEIAGASQDRLVLVTGVNGA